MKIEDFAMRVLSQVACGLCVLMVYLFHYKDRSKFFLICALNFFFDFLVETERTRETRENTLSHNSRFSFLFFFEDLAAEGDTSSATGVSDDLASVEREESNERLEASSVIKTSRKASSVLSLRTKPSSLSFSGKRRGIEPNGRNVYRARNRKGTREFG